MWVGLHAADRTILKETLEPYLSKRAIIYIKIFTLWILWLGTSTVFYSIRDTFGWGIGYYMAVNIGYSIGWGYPYEKDSDCEIYSIFNILIGASAVHSGLAVFADSMISSSRRVVFLRPKTDKSTSKILAYFQSRISDYTAILLWAIWVGLFALWAYLSIPSFTVVDSLYLSISSFSTGGLWAIPSNSPVYQFVIG